jgi:methyl-accepting chemotaxis protein
MVPMLTLLRNFSIRMRMLGAIGAVLGMFALVGLTGLVGGARIQALTENFMAHSIAEMQSVSALRAQMATIRQLEKQMVIDYEMPEAVARHETQWREAIAATRDRLEAMLEGDEDADDAHARKALEHLDLYVQGASVVVRNILRDAYDTARVADRQLGRAHNEIAVVEAEIQTIAEIVQQEVVATEAAMAGTMRAVLIAFCAVLALVVGMVVPLTLANSRSITEPVAHAAAVAESIAAGDLTTPIRHAGRDETAQLLAALGRMQASLGSVVGAVRHSSRDIRTASGEVAAGSADLSARTEQTAGSLQQTASTMEQLTGTVRQSAEAARQASGLAQAAVQAAERGGSVVAQVVATMSEIHSASQRIADIIGVIDGIAFQTNILALNAAVEAARAGEQGRGFAVVAAEVRSLAQRSAEAAKEIKGLIGASVEKVDSGSRLVGDAGTTMTQVVAEVRRVTQVVSEISTAAADQSDGIGQVNGAVGQLDGMTQRNAALVEQSAAAADALQSQAQRLAELVERFRVDPRLETQNA